jgi:nitrate reductase gamma subunit
MTLYQGIGLFFAVYVLLLARSAWKQGEMAQFFRSLAVVAGLAAVLALVIGGAILLEGR